MSDPATIARDYLEGWNRRDWDRWRELFHPQYSYTGGDGVREEGPEAGMAIGHMFANAFPDGKIEIRHLHVAGNTAVVEFTGSGTHQGELLGIAPTGRRMSIPVCTIIEVQDGQIIAEREYMDFAHIMQQLGVMPAGATA